MRNRSIITSVLIAFAAVIVVSPGARVKAAAPYQEAFRGITALSVVAV